MQPVQNQNQGGYQGTGQTGTFGGVTYRAPDANNPYGSYVPASTATSSVSQSNQPINAQQLGNTPNTQVPPPVNTNTAQMNLGTQVGTFTESATGNQQLAQDEAKAQQVVTPTSSRQGILDKISSLLGVQATQGEETAKIFGEEGVQAKKDEVRRLEGEALAKDRAYQKQAEAILANPEGKLESGVAIDLANLERQRNSELADIAIQSKIATGNYQSAFEIADAKVKAQFEPIENQIKSLQNLYQLYGDDLTESEKMQAEEKIQAKRDALNFAQQKELINYKAQIDMAQKLQEQNAGGLLGTPEQQAKFIKDPTAQKASSRTGVISAVRDYMAKLERYAGPAGEFDWNRLSKKEKAELESALNTTVGSAINVAQGQGAMGDQEAERILGNLRPRRIRTSIIKSAGQGVIDAQTSLLNQDLNLLSLQYPNVRDLPMFNQGDPLGLGISDGDLMQANPLGI